MEDLEKLLGETTDNETSGVNRAQAPNSREDNHATMSASAQSQWCPSCQKKAEDLEEKYTRNFIAIKQKVFFTDNLIQMYQKAKKQLAEATDRCNQAVKDKSLVQAQLEMLLSKEQPPVNELEALHSRNVSLEDQVEDLKTRLHAMDESRKLHEESLKVLKAEGGVVVNEMRRKYLQQISELKKEMAEKATEHKQLLKRCNRLQQRVEKLTKKPSAEQHTNITDQTGNTTILDQSLNEMNSDAEDNSGATETSKATEKVQVTLPTEATEPQAEPKDEVAHITSTLVAKHSQKQIRDDSGKTRLAEEETKNYFPTQLTEQQVSDLSFIATKWREISSAKPVPKKQDLMDDLLKRISEFCVKHQITSRNSVLKKFLDLHKDLYSIRHRRWITDVIKGGDVIITRSSSLATATHIPHPSNQVETMFMSSTDDSETADEPLDTVTSEKLGTSLVSPKSAEANVSLSSTMRDHVSVMPDISDNTDVDTKLQGDDSQMESNPLSAVNLPTMTEKEQKTSEDSKDANSKMSEQHEGAKETENLFSLQLTEVQLSDLSSIAAKWRVLVCKRPSPRKQALLNKLLEDISQFCKEHRVESREAVLEKFYNLHHNLYSKKHCQWLIDIIKKPSVAISASDSAKEDGTNTNDIAVVAANLPRSNNSENEGSVDTNYPGSRPEAKSDEHVSVMPDVTANAVQEMPSPVVEEESKDVIARKSQSVSKRKRQISGNSKKTNKVPRLAEFHLPQVVSRRRTRSMRASSSSEQEDAIEQRPEQRSRRRKSSKSSGSEKKSAKLTSNPTATIRQSEEVIEFAESNNAEIVRKKKLVNEGDEIKTLPNESITSMSKKRRKLSDGIVQNTEGEKTQEKSHVFISGSLPERITVIPATDSPAEYIDLLDIFNEMLPFGAGRLSPLPQSPFRNTETKDAEKPPALDGSQPEEGAEEVSLLPDDHRGRDSISPSTDLCTVLNFGTPKRKVHEKTSEIKQSNKTPDLKEETVLPKQDISHSASYAVVDSESTSDSTLHESPLLCQSSVAKDILKPRRFSCEAPEKAVSVPPIKPTSTASSLERIRSPLVVSSTGDSGQNSSFPPLRKEEDIPSHWHQSTSHSKGDKSDMEKDLLLSDDEEPKQSDELSVDKVNPDVSSCSDYDTDSVIKDMTRSSPLLSAFESGADLIDSPKSQKNCNVDAQVSSPKKSSSDKSALSPVKVDLSTIVKDPSGSGISSADDKSLIMDLSDDIIDEKGVEMDRSDNQAKECAESSQDNEKSANLCSTPPGHSPPCTQQVIQNDCDTTCSAIKISTLSHSNKTDAVEKSYYISTPRDFKSLFTKGRKIENRKIIVKDSFIVEGISSILEETTTEFDLFTKDGDNSEGYTIEDLPECEGRFLRRIHLLHGSGIVEADFLTKTVIPVLLKMHEKLGNCYSDVKKFMAGEGDDSCYAQLHLFLSRVKSTLGVSLSRMLAFMRVFVFVCKMAGTVAPIYAVCRYHLLWTRATKLVVSLIQGLLCWPTGLKQRPVLGKTVMRVLRKSMKSSQVLSRKLQAVGLVKQLDWIDQQCRWRTSSVNSIYSLREVKSTIDDAMSRIKAAAFSTEFKEFLESGENCRATSQCIPVFDQDTTIGLHLLEFIPKESVVDDVKNQIFDCGFWPLLNKWSTHLHNHGDVDENREVSNTCTLAILHSFAQILSTYLLRQRLQHKDQPTVPRLQAHYRIICSMMDNFATLYIRKAPRLVQCATASFLIRTCFCNPSAAFQSLLKWAKATISQTTLEGKRHEDLSLIVILSECEERTVKQICIWLDEICSSKSGDNLVKFFWPD